MNARAVILLTLRVALPFGIGPAAALPQQPKAAPPGAEAQGPADRPEDIKTLVAPVQAFTEAFNESDAKAIAELFTDDAELAEEAGGTGGSGRPVLRGRGRTARPAPGAGTGRLRRLSLGLGPRLLGRPLRRLGPVRPGPRHGAGPGRLGAGLLALLGLGLHAVR